MPPTWSRALRVLRTDTAVRFHLVEYGEPRMFTERRWAALCASSHRPPAVLTPIRALSLPTSVADLLVTAVAGVPVDEGVAAGD